MQKLMKIWLFSVENDKTLPAPFALSKTQWVNDAKLWPDIGYPDIYNYFVDSSSFYTKDEFKAYKSLEGYEYFIDRHVQPVLFHNPEVEDYVYLMADVLPSQRQSGKKGDLYHTYLIVHRSGEIHTAHCTCMAGAGKACSHAFKVEMAIRTGLTKSASTSLLCVWNDQSKRKAEPNVLSKIEFKRRKYGEEALFDVAESENPTQSCNALNIDMGLYFISLKEIKPEAVIFSSTEMKSKPLLPPTITQIVQMTENEICGENFQDLFSNLLTSETVFNLEQATVRQSRSRI